MTTLLKEILALGAAQGVKDIEDVHKGVSGNRRQAQEQFQHLIGKTVNVILAGGKFSVISRMGEPQAVVVLDKQPITVNVIAVEQAGVSSQSALSIGSVYFRVALVSGQDQQADIGGTTKSLAEHFPTGKMIIRGSNLATK